MKNAKQQLKVAIQKTTQFMLKLEVNSTDRIPEWFDQMALSSSHEGLSNSLYESLLEKLRYNLNSEFGRSATKFLMK